MAHNLLTPYSLLRAGDSGGLRGRPDAGAGPQALADTPGRIGKPVPYRLQQLHNVPFGDLRDRHIPDGGKDVAPKNLQPVTRVLEVSPPSARGFASCTRRAASTTVRDRASDRRSLAFGWVGRGCGPRRSATRYTSAALRASVRGDGGIPAKDLVRAPAVLPHPQNPGLGSLGAR